MATKVILKPGGIALIAVGLIAVVGMLWSRASNKTQPTSSETQPFSEDSFWLAAKPAVGNELIIEDELTISSKTKKRLHIKNDHDRGDEWNLKIGSPIMTALHAGEQKTLTFWARSDAPATKIIAVVEIKTPPFERLLSEEVSLTTDWKEYRLHVTPNKELSADSCSVAFMLGKTAADCYISGVQF
jgi:hypothetical protein